jgi:hypothetical protein
MLDTKNTLISQISIHAYIFKGGIRKKKICFDYDVNTVICCEFTIVEDAFFHIPPLNIVVSIVIYTTSVVLYSKF